MATNKGRFDHFVTQAAHLILERFPNEEIYTCESGVTPSGKIHLGNLLDLTLCDGVLRELSNMGYKARHILFIDSQDPLRRLPVFVPKEFIEKEEEFRGFPLEDLPDPWGCHENYAEHFVSPVREHAADFGIKLEILFAGEFHKRREYIEEVKFVFENRERFIEVLNRIRSAAGHKTLYPEDWIPYMPICNTCGRIAEWAVKPTYIDGYKVSYHCDVCKEDGEVDIRDGRGKLPWRLEWPARWKIFHVNFEPLGKDHLAAGSSFDTGRAVLKEIWNRPEPVSIFYDFVYIRSPDGKLLKMSKRKGIGLGLDEWLEIAPPEAYRFNVFRHMLEDVRTSALPHWEFDYKRIFELVDRYDWGERIYFNVKEEVEKIDENVRRRIVKAYLLSQVDKPPSKLPLQLPYRFAAVLSQILDEDREEERLISILRRTGYLTNSISEEDLINVKKRIKMARRWIELYAPEFKLKVIEKLPVEMKDSLSEKQRKALGLLAEALKSRTWSENELFNEFYNIIKSVGLSSKEFFEAAYMVLLGKKSGPRLAGLLLSLEKDWVIKRLEEVGK